MASLTTNEISSAALVISFGALIVSIRLPLYLAGRAERRARLEKDREKLPPFYRKVKEFADGFNTPGVGFQIRDIYDLSNEAGELGLGHFQEKLTDLWRAIEKHHDLFRDKMGEWNEQGEFDLNPDITTLGKEVQQKLRVIYGMAIFENEQLYNRI